jgi:hypothetical protein
MLGSLNGHRGESNYTRESTLNPSSHWRWSLAAPAVWWLLLTGCASSSAVLIGHARLPIAPAAVTVYSSPPPAFETIAALSASRKSVYLFAGEGLDDAIIERLKVQAAKVGANGLLLGEFTDDDVISLGGGAGTQSYTHNGDISLGMGGAFSVFKRTIKGRAIVVPPG